MAQRVLLHVGTPKTGTSQLQEVLFRNRDRLRKHGIYYPADRFDAHFLAALDLMSLPWGGLEAEAIGAWPRLAAQVREAEGTAIISHEILARATAAQAARAVASLGEDAEVHLVLSVRDLVRQIPAEWQENVKHRSPYSYAEFLRSLQGLERDEGHAPWFWAVQEIPDIIERWGRGIPPERVHLVTVPAPGSPSGLLWKRFERAFGLADLGLDLDVDRSNPSLGVAETTLIRRINQATSRLEGTDYRPLVRELLAHRTLARRPDAIRLGLPKDAYVWARGLSDAWIEEIRIRGYQVVGDIEDLRGADWPGDFHDPDAPADEAVVDAAVDAVRALIGEAARRRRHIERLEARLAVLEGNVERVPLRRRAAEAVVRGLRSNPAGRSALRVYRRARGRNSLSA